MEWLFCSGLRDKTNANVYGEICHKKLCEFSIASAGVIKIKCHRCGTVNDFIQIDPLKGN